MIITPLAIVDASQRIRLARWLVEQVQDSNEGVPVVHATLEDARVRLGFVGGDYRQGEVEQFTTLGIITPAASKGD